MIIEPKLIDTTDTFDILKSNFFYKFLNYLEKNSTTKTCYKNLNVENSNIILDFVNKKYFIAKNYENRLFDCINDSSINFIILPFSILRNSDSFGHFNIIIINKTDKKIEYFEPHGSSLSPQLVQNKFIIKHILGIIHKLTRNKIIHYKFSDAHILCPFGLQYKQESIFYIDESLDLIKYGPKTEKGLMTGKYGLCVAWCLLCIHLRLLNPTVSIKHIIKNIFNKYNSYELNTYINKYIHLIINTNTIEIPTQTLYDSFNLKI